MIAIRITAKIPIPIPTPIPITVTVTTIPYLPGSVSSSPRLSSPFLRGFIMKSCCRHEFT